MSGTTTINCPSGFFLNDSVTPATVTDLESAVQDALNNVTDVSGSVTAAANSATAAAASATAAAGSQSAASTSESSAGASATSATSAATTATTQATNASTSASNASGSATAAAGSATAAATSASNAATSATNASNSASAAATSATNAAASSTAAANSATAAANSAAVVPTPSVSSELNFIRINASGTAYEVRTPAQVVTDLGLSGGGGSGGNVVNMCHNPLFNVRQRGNGPFNVSWNTNADRWYNTFFGTDPTMSTTLTAISFADKATIGDEAAEWAAVCTITGGTDANGACIFTQDIDDILRFSGRTITVSFWAKAASGTPKVGVSIDLYGGGGQTGTGQAVTISTTWARYHVSIPLTSASSFGVTDGSGSHAELNFWLTAGANNNSASGSIGLQSNTFSFWGVQVEEGSTMSPLVKNDPDFEFMRCQAYYSTGNIQLDGNAGGASQAISQTMSLPVTMRATPTINVTWTTQTNGTGAVTPLDATTFKAAITSTAAGAVALVGTYTASAEEF